VGARGLASRRLRAAVRIDKTSGDGTGSATPDAPPAVTSLQWVRMSVGKTVERAPHDLTGQTATVLDPRRVGGRGLRRITAMQSAVDTWSAEIADGAPPIEFTLPDFPVPLPRLFALPSRNMVDSTRCSSIQIRRRLPPARRSRSTSRSGRRMAVPMGFSS